MTNNRQNADFINRHYLYQAWQSVIEISESVNLDTTSENKIVGIEILHASKKMNINTAVVVHVSEKSHLSSKDNSSCKCIQLNFAKKNQ